MTPDTHPPTPAILLKVEDLVVGTRDDQGREIRLVDGVSFEIAEGEVLCIVGESGSGKSITMAAVLGLLPPGVDVLSGRVEYRGEDLLAASEKRLRELRGRRLAMVFQDPMTALNPVARVGAQIARAVRLHGDGVTRAQADRRAAELLAAVGVPDAAARARAYPHQWSGGMRQRAVIAAAIAHDPDLLVADEPTTALDVTIQAQIMDLLAQARRRTGAAMALITHDLGLVAQTADRIVIMYSGRIVESGTVWDLFDAPRHPYTAGLLASLLTAESSSGRAYAIPGSPPQPAARPAGCPFAPRCELPAKSARCRTDLPPLRVVSPAHDSACHHAESVSRFAQEVAG
ncbi:ABC transporter ATP-binding protein [Microbacterium laevaniformans]|uniref:ABC transporter ATP-binding protein n=1 Tax=Microbacterium laevaniformans TaxID=36807 RepID=UPI0025DAAC36|nr:ABC transporter ATP-binding protein [uncultured Microbacterium sp.]